METLKLIGQMFLIFVGLAIVGVAYLYLYACGMTTTGTCS